jgi:hypothetical protein
LWLLGFTDYANRPNLLIWLAWFARKEEATFPLWLLGFSGRGVLSWRAVCRFLGAVAPNPRSWHVWSAFGDMCPRGHSQRSAR